MSGYNGRSLTIDMASTTLTGVQTRGFTAANAPVDVTNDDDSGARTLLAEPGTRATDLSVAGITSDEVLIAAMYETPGGFTLKAIEIFLPTGVGAATPGKLAGDFFVASLEVTGEHDGAVEFTASLQSAGVITYTATVA